MATRLVLIAIVGLLATAKPVHTHHSFSTEFDINQPIKFTGAVTRLEWVNPHAWLYIDVKDDNGNVASWGWEMGSPNLLTRLGWMRNSLKPGDVVTIEGYRARDGSNVANAGSIMLNGKRLFAGSSKAVTP